MARSSAPHRARSRSSARALTAALRALGRAVFCDADDVRPGDRWRQVIEPALNGARMVVVLVDPASGTGERLYYTDEIGRAVARERGAGDPVRVVPVTIGRVAVRDLPIGLAELTPVVPARRPPG